MKALLFHCMLFFTIESKAVGIRELKNALLSENHDLKLYENKWEIAKENYRASKSYLFPKLSLNLGASTGKEKGDTIQGVSSSAGGALGAGVSQSQAAETVNIEKESWSADTTLSYVLFSRFSISANIKSSRNGKTIGEYDFLDSKDEKVKQLYHLVLEVKAFEEMQKLLEEAKSLVSKINKRPTNSFFGGTDDEQSLNYKSKENEIDYQMAKVSQTLDVSRQGLLDLIPKIKEEWLTNLPAIEITYEMKNLEEFKKAYLAGNRKVKKLNLDIESYDAHLGAIRWERPWIPTVALSSSYSEFGDFKKSSNRNDDWRASILFSFNLFDGFNTSARRAQMRYAYDSAVRKKESLISKDMIFIVKTYHDTNVAKHEYYFKNAIVREKEMKAKKLGVVGASGSSLSTEKAVLKLELAKAKIDAFESKRKYQHALLGLAELAGEFDKVVVNEKI